MKDRLAWSAVALLLAVQAWLILANLHMDGDTLRNARQLTYARTFADAMTHRANYAALYAGQSPAIWAADRALRSWLGGWNELATHRLFAAAACAAIAWLLSAAVRREGGGALERALAALFPFCVHGFSFLAASCDDNATTDVWRLAAVVAVLGTLRGRVRPVTAGLLLGGAVIWHWQSVLLLPAAGWLFWRRDEGSFVGRLNAAAQATVLPLAVYGLWMGVVVASGVLSRTSGGELIASLVGHHRGPFWFPSADRGLWNQASLVWEGVGRMTLGYGWIRPGGFAGAAGAVAGAGCGAALLALSLRALRGSPARAAILAVLAIQVPHSFLYEPESVERWDMPVLLTALAAGLALARLRAAGNRGERRRLLAVAAATLLVLGGLNAWGWRRFAGGAERAFLETAAGAADVEEIKIDSIGAQRRLNRAAAAFARAVGPGEGFSGLLSDTAHEGNVTLYWLVNNLGNYLAVYEPEFRKPHRPGGYMLAVMRPPPRSADLDVVAADGYLYLLRKR